MSRFLTPNAGGGGIGSRVKGIADGTQAAIGAPGETDIEFEGADEYDTDDWHDPSVGAGTDFTVPTGKAGLYLIVLNVDITKTTNASVYITITSGTAGVLAINDSFISATARDGLNAAAVVQLADGEVITGTIDVSGGSATVDTGTYLAITRLGDTV
jgi:hypothetical protein